MEKVIWSKYKLKAGVAGSITDNTAIWVLAKTDFKVHFLTVKCEIIMKIKHF